MFAIDIQMSTDSGLLLFTAASGSALPSPAPLEVPISVGHAKLAEFRKEATKILEKISQAATCGGLNLKNGGWRDVCHGLRKGGRELLMHLLNHDASAISRICRWVCDAHPLWNINDSLPPVVELRSQLGCGLPLDLMPLFSVAPPQDVASGSELSKCSAFLRIFPAFNSIIRRVVKSRHLPRSNSLSNDPLLPVKCVANTRLKGATLEVSRFREVNDWGRWVDLDGPYPGQHRVTEKEACRAIAQCFIDPALSFQGNSVPAAQVLHFACHYDTSAPNSGDHFVSVSGTEGAFSELRISLREIHNAMSDDRDIENVLLPLGFLNGCNTSSVSPNSLMSLPAIILSGPGTRGFIGTEIRIPDEFAAELSDAFYRNLLAGDNVGESLFYARWKLVQRFLNPLGVMYTLYASPELRAASARLVKLPFCYS